jgi:zinc/manganese transport system ATP-binding protein
VSSAGGLSEPASPEPACPDGEALIELRDAAVELGGHRVWDGVTLSVGAGEFVAVLGPNGAGKSTLLKALLGLVRVVAGSVRVAGQSPRRGDHQIGYLPQRRSFDPGLRVRGIDIVRLGVDGDRWGLPVARRRRAARARVDELLDLVGATDLAGRPIGQLSGGEQQRLLIAQALARRPRLLLLDEPLDSLDLPNQAAIAALIADLCRDEGVAVLIVAHDVNPVLSYVDRVLYVAGGSALVGPPEAVITGPALSRLYGAPIEVLRASDGRLVVVGQPEAASYHPQLHPHEAPHAGRG